MSYPPPANIGYGPPSGPPPGPGQYQSPSGPPPVPAHSYPGASPGAPSAYAPPAGPPPSNPYGAYAPPPGPPPPSSYAPTYAPPPGPPPPGAYAPTYAPPPGPPPPSGYAPVYAQPQQPYNPQYPTPQLGSYPPAQAQYVPPATTLPSGPVEPILWYLGAPVPNPFSYDDNAVRAYLEGFDPAPTSDAIRKATKGLGTDDTKLISLLSPLTSLQAIAVGKAFRSAYGKDLTETIESNTSGWFKEGLRAITLGPLEYDLQLVHKALSGLGTNESVVTEVLLDRRNAELEVLKGAYRLKYNRDLTEAVRSDLSGSVERLFTMALTANRPSLDTYINPADIEKDVKALYDAGEAKLGTDETTFCRILTNRNAPYLERLVGAYKEKHHKTLTKVIKSEFSGHLRSALLHIARGVKTKRTAHFGGYDYGVWRDAKLLEKSMAGLGTKDSELVMRLLRGHWDRKRFESVKEAYQNRYKKELSKRVSGETSGAYKKLMLTLIK